MTDNFTIDILTGETLSETSIEPPSLRKRTVYSATDALAAADALNNRTPPLSWRSGGIRTGDRFADDFFGRINRNSAPRQIGSNL